MSDFYNKYPYTDFHELNLDWIIERVKQLTADWLETKQVWENTEADWQELYDYVHDYFDNLDVQQEINNKINAMIADGTFVTITTPVIEAKVASMMPGTVASQIGDTVASQIGATVASQIGATVSNQINSAVVSPVNTWLSEHITQPTTPVVDTSLSISGAAADAAVVGARFGSDEWNIDNIEMKLSGINMKIQVLDSTQWESSNYWAGPNDKRSTGDSGYAAYPKITLPAGTYFYTRMNSEFSWAKPEGGSSYKPFNAAQGTFTLSVKTDLYLTVQYPTSDYTMCMLANGVLPVSYVLGVYDTSIPTLYDKTDKTVTDGIINEISVINNYTQFLDSTDWTQYKYYAGANDLRTTSDAGYAAYPPITVPAGTYNYLRMNTAFSFAKGSGSSYQPFATTTGTVTFAETTTLWLTCAYNVTDYTRCMLSNGDLPASYTHGIYLTEIPTLDNAEIRDYITVDASGHGDFTTIQDALDWAPDSASNRVVIVVMPGTYDKFTTKKNGNMIVRYIDIIGIDRNNTIVYTDTGDYYNPPANILMNGTVKNMSFISTNDNFVGSDVNYSYAIHMDFNPGANTRYENCYMYSENGPAIGIGMYSNETLQFNNCQFVCNHTDAGHGTSGLGAFYLHARGDSSAVNQLLEMQNCQAINKHGTYGICLHELNAGSQQGFNIVNTAASGTGGASAQITGTWSKGYSYGNNASALNA